jgi:hypothetical protein
MKTIRSIGWMCLILLSFGCSTLPISANPVQDIAGALPAPSGPLSIQDGLREAAFNLDNAVIVGALTVDDPAPACVHDAMTRLGLNPLQPPAPSFIPQTTTLIGKGSVAYIRARQARRLQGTGFTVTTDCKALIGEIVLAAGETGTRILPGGGLAIPIR